MAAEDVRQGAEDGPREWQRFFMGYRERFVDNCDVALSNGKTISVAQSPSASASAKRLGGKLDKASDPALTGTTVWDGAIVLAQYLTATTALQQHAHEHGFPSGEAKPASCVELGAGTGVASLALAACECAGSVIMTDIPDVLPHIELCISMNKQAIGSVPVKARRLRWSLLEDVERLQSKGLEIPVDLIIGSDLIYYTYCPATPHSELLLVTLEHLSGPQTAIFLALSLHHNPEEVESFLKRAAGKFHVARIPGSSLPAEYDVPDVMVVKLLKKGGL